MKNKTKKKKINKIKENKDYYQDKFYNTSLIPDTSIIKFINDNRQEYLKNELANNSQNLFSFYFDVQDNFINGNIVNINQQINESKMMNVNKLLANALYKKSNDFFKQTNKLDLKLLKNQIGKDTTRINITINNNQYNYETNIKGKEVDFITNDEKADSFIITLIQYLSKYSNNIDFTFIFFN
jgi:hypothetical protein